MQPRVNATLMRAGSLGYLLVGVGVVAAKCGHAPWWCAVEALWLALRPVVVRAKW